MITLILGGARSGKSAYAEQLAAESAGPVVYLATATAGDEEMLERIARHRALRPVDWRTVEEPHDLERALRTLASPGDIVVLDCLTLWVSNRLLTDAAPTDVELVREVEAVVAAARDVGLDLIAVSNEVGMGVVPAYPLGRRYRDALGRINQSFAARADRVVLMVAGLPLMLKGH